MHQIAPPQTYTDFVAAFPELAHAWELIAEAGKQGPLPAESLRLLKLAVALGAGREGAVRAGVRKALAEGVSVAELHQVIALLPSYIGLPATVAAFSWVREVLAGGTASTQDQHV